MRKKRNYLKTEMEIVWFDEEDVIVTSGDESGDDVDDETYSDPNEL